MPANQVPTSNINALYANTTAGTKASPTAMDAGLQDVVSTVNSNATAFNSFQNAADLEIQDQSVRGQKIKDGTITTAKLADQAVTTPKIALGAVGSAQLNPNLLTDFGDIAVQAEFDRRGINVLKFGADPSGLTDSTASIQSAINYASSLREGTTQTERIVDLIFPSGVYNVTNLTMSDNYNFCNLIGVGVATLNHIGTGTLLYIGNTLFNGIMPVRVKNLFFKRSDKLSGTVGLKVQNASNGYFENLGASGFETAFLSLGCINNLWDFKRNFISGTKYAFVADISILTSPVRLDSNLLHIENAHFAGEYGFTLKGQELAGGTGSGGLVKLSFCTFEGITTNSVSITNAGEIKGLDVVELDHCWFESYGTLLLDVYYSKVIFNHCFIVGASSKVIVLEDSFSQVHFENTSAYFLDSAPTSGCLIEIPSGGSFEISRQNISFKRSEFRGLTKATSTINFSGGVDLPTDNAVTMSLSKQGNVVFRISLSTLTGGDYRAALMELSFINVEPSFGTNSVSKYLASITGLSTWNGITTTKIIGADLTITISNSTNNGVTVTILNGATYNAYVNVTVLDQATPSIKPL